MKTEKPFAKFGKNCRLQPYTVVGLKYKEGCGKTTIGNNAIIRTFTVIYADVIIGDDLKTGHNVLIREKTIIGNKTVIGSGTVIDGNAIIGNRVKLESNVYIPTRSKIGNDVFIGPGVVLTNDKYPQRRRSEYEPKGPIIHDSVSIGANSTILPGIEVNEGALIAAGSVVTRDVPAWHMAIGTPARVSPLDGNLVEKNKAIKW
jgi:acetyltransferase-like isoleucine patch superfamily enzyme